MSIYITKSVTYNPRVEVFENHGLHNQVAGRVSEGSINPIADPPLAFTVAVSNIHSILTAGISKKGVFGRSPMANVLKQFSVPALEAPSLYIQAKSGGDALNAYGMFEAGSGKMGVYIGKPNIMQLGEITRLGYNLYDTPPAGNVNLAGYIAWVYAWRGVLAFKSVGLGPSDQIPMRVWVGEDIVKSLAPAKAEDKHQGFIRMGNVQYYSVPQTSNAIGSGLFISPASTPGGSGHVFPYFKEMLDGDPDFAFGVFSRLFSKSYADNETELGELATILRRGFRYLANCGPGRVLQHVYFAIDLSIKTGDVPHFIIDGGEYAGFCLMGGSCKILDKNVLKSPLESDAIRVELSKINEHAVSVESLCAILEGIDMIDGTTGSIDRPKALTSPRYLRNEINKRPVNLVEENKTVLKSCIEKMKYAQQYWEITPENILKLISRMSSKADMGDEPMYASDLVLLNRTSDILSYLAVFGQQAPSIFEGNSIKQIARSEIEDPNLVENSDKKRAVPYIPYYKKGLIAAAGDWSNVRNNKSFKFIAPKKNEQGGFASVKARSGVIANPHFPAFYTFLRQWVYTEREIPMQTQSKKRGMDIDDNAEAGPSRKKVAYTFV